MSQRIKDCALALILAAWLDRPDEERTEVKMFGFAFDTAADPLYRFTTPPEMYRIIRAHLYEHGRIVGPILEEH